MKKLFLAVALVAALGMASCGKKAEKTDAYNQTSTNVDGDQGDKGGCPNVGTCNNEGGCPNGGECGKCEENGACNPDSCQNKECCKAQQPEA